MSDLTSQKNADSDRSYSKIINPESYAMLKKIIKNLSKLSNNIFNVLI